MRFAERVLHGVGDDGSREEIVIWIERRPGAVWAVGRAIDPRNRTIVEPIDDDYVFEGFELGDALEAANGALRDDLRVSEEEEHLTSFFSDFPAAVNSLQGKLEKDLSEIDEKGLEELGYSLINDGIGPMLRNVDELGP